MLHFSPSHETHCHCGGGGGDRGVTISRFPNPVLPPPVLFCPFVSQLPLFIVFLPLSCKSCCLTPYSNRECFGLVQNKKMCRKSNHSALSSATIEAAFFRHKFTPRGKTFSFLWIIVVRSEFPGRSSMDGFSISPPHRKIPRPIKMVFDDIWPDSLCRSGEGKRRNEFEEWHVAWLAEWHNYVECKLNIRRMTQRNKLNWKVRHFLAPIDLQTQPLF